MSFGINIPKVNIPDRIQPQRKMEQLEKRVSSIENNVVPELKNDYSKISRKLDEYSGKDKLNQKTPIDRPSEFEFPTKIKTNLGNRVEILKTKEDEFIDNVNESAETVKGKLEKLKENFVNRVETLKYKELEFISNIHSSVDDIISILAKDKSVIKGKLENLKENLKDRTETIKSNELKLVNNIKGDLDNLITFTAEEISNDPEMEKSFLKDNLENLKNLSEKLPKTNNFGSSNLSAIKEIIGKIKSETENIIEKIDKNTKFSPYKDKYGSSGGKIDITDDDKKHKLTIIASQGGRSESPPGMGGSVGKTQILFGDDKEQYGIAIDVANTPSPAGPVPIPYIIPEKKTGEDEDN